MAIKVGSRTQEFPVIEIDHVNKKEGDSYVFKIDGIELHGIQSYEIHKEKEFPWPLVTIVIQPRKLIEKIFRGTDELEKKTK